jgi:putative inorganic carbon (HCO3(-)) transporter
VIDYSRAEWWRPLAQADAGDRSPTVAAVSTNPVPFWALMVFTFILFVGPQTTFLPVLAPFRVGLLTGGFALAAHLLDALVHGRRLPFPSEVRIVACLVAWAIATIPLSSWPGGSLGFLVGGYLKPVALFWLLSDVVNTVARFRLVAWALTLMTIPIATTAVHHFITGTFIPGQVDKRIVGYEAPLTGNPNALALVLDLILPLTLALFMITRTTWIRAVLFAVVALNAAGVIVTFSRGGFLILAMVLAVYGYRLLRRPERPWALVAVGLLLACLPLVPSDYLDRLSTISDIESDPTGSAQTRWRDTLIATELVAANPIVGAGIGQGVLALNEVRGATWLPVHNVYLEYAVDLGLPGLLLFLWLLVRCIKSSRLVRQQSAGVPASRDLFFLSEAVYTSLVAFAVGGVFYEVAYECYFYYFAGLAVALRAVHAGRHSVSPS